MSLIRRTGVWRLTRNETVRGIGRAVQRLGFTAAVMDWFRASADGDCAAEDAAEADVELAPLVEVGQRVPERLRGDYDERDAVLCAVERGEIVGHCLLSERPVNVPEVGTLVDPAGTYLWRLYVRPNDRGRGIGTALLRRARERAARVGLDAVHALVAIDNPPSRAAFRRAGYEATDRVAALGVAGRSVSYRWAAD